MTCLGHRATAVLSSQNSGNISARSTYFHSEILSTAAFGSGGNPSLTYTALGSLREMSAGVHGSMPAVPQDKMRETIDDMVWTAPNEYAPDEPNEVESLPPPTGLSPNVTISKDANDPTPANLVWQSRLCYPLPN